MKNKFIYAVCVMAATMFCACGPDPEPGPYGEPLGSSVYIVKMSKPEYKDLVLVRKYHRVSYEAYCFNRCEEPIGKTGYSPYWELPNGWLLVDWKWTGFFRCDYGYTALTKQTWDKYDGLDAEGNPQKWPLTIPHTKDNPVSQFEEVYVPGLATYSNNLCDESSVLLLKQYFRCHFLRDVSLCDEAERMDSIWTILQADLTAVIEKGDMDKLWQYEPAEDSYWYN